MTAVYDVGIVGAGPVGQVLAVLLGRSGRRVAVLDKQPEPYPRPRAVHFDGEVARLLQAVGVADDAGDWSEPLDAYEWRNAAGEVLLRLQAEGLPATSGWPPSTMFCQPEMEKGLAGRLAGEPTVDVLRGWEVVGLEPGRASVLATARSGGGDHLRIEASWLVGCDGRSSFVREATGIATEDLGYYFDWLIVDVVPREPGVWEPRNIQVCDPRRPTTAVSGGPGRRRWEFMRLPGEDPAHFAEAETAWRLLRPWGMTPTTARLERHAIYTFSARIAADWRRDRVLLAGDAAHQMPPFAGQGLCAGIRDAANLAWKLDLVLAGRAPAELLDSYACERAPSARAMIELSIELGRIICVADPVAAAARDREMVAAARQSGPVPIPPPPPITTGVVAAGDAHAGHPWIQGRVAHAGRVGRFDDVVGRGWMLVGAATDPSRSLRGGEAAWWAAIGGRAVGFDADSPFADIDGSYAAWFARHGVACVLVRPDFIVFASATDSEGAGGLVRAARAAIRSPSTSGTV